MVKAAQYRQQRKSRIRPAKLTPELMAEGWTHIVNAAINQHKLSGNDLRIIMDDALTRAGIIWDVEYNVKKLHDFDVSWMDTETYTTLVRGFVRAVNAMIDGKEGYVARPLYERMINVQGKPFKSVTNMPPDSENIPQKSPRLRRSYSKRLKVRK